MPAFPAVGDPGTNTVAPPNDHASKLLAALGVSIDLTDGTLKPSFVKIGTNPATAGAVRLANADWMAGRNAANSLNINMFKVNASNNLETGAQLFRDGFNNSGGFDDTTAFLNFRRRFNNLTGSQKSIISVHGYASGQVSVSDRANGIYSVVEDDVSAVGTSPVQNKTITNMTRVSTTVTVTANAHGFLAGDRIAIYGVLHTFNAEVNGSFTVANPAANTFEITVAGLSSGTYTSGGTVTNRPMMYAGFFGATVLTARGGLTGTAAHGDDVACVVAINGGTAKGTDAYYLGRNAAIAGSEWTTCMTFDANGDHGIRLNGTYVTSGVDFGGTFTGNAIRMAGTYGLSPITVTGTTTTGPVIGLSGTVTAGSGIALSGSYGSYGIDMAIGTYTGGAIRLKNNTAVVGRNNANSADVQLFYINTLDELQIAPTVRCASMTVAASNQITLGAGTNIAPSTTTGTKIGTLTTQLIGFWNKTPVAQPSSTGETVGFTAGGGTTVTDASTFTGNVGATAYRISDIVKHLKNIGLIAS